MATAWWSTKTMRVCDSSAAMAATTRAPRFSVTQVLKPDLAIISEDLWKAAHASLARSRRIHTGHRKDNGQLAGRPAAPSHHSLGGILQCGECGRSLVPIAERPSPPFGSIGRVGRTTSRGRSVLTAS
jgi:hypothetical protein